MFIHQEHLRHLLRPADYFEAAPHFAELEHVFHRSWHFLATRGELCKPGDFKTLELLGVPILVRNFEGEIAAFLNVCSHRHCRLTNVCRGNSDALRCQYHGWEYEKDGRTGKIPDARAFRPWDREHSQLAPIRTQALGEMVYFTLDEQAPSLEDYLGKFCEIARHWFDGPYEFAACWEFDYPANWKIVVENSLESYHIPCIHQQTFGEMPRENDCEHELDADRTTFHTREPANWQTRVRNRFVRWLGVEPTNVYTHTHHHPNLIFVRMDVMRMAQLMMPLSATTTRHLVWVYSLRRPKGRPMGRLIHPLVRWLTVKIAKQVVAEDSTIFGEVQRGMERSPFRGVIGTREERLYLFQQWVLSATGRSPATHEIPPNGRMGNAGTDAAFESGQSTAK